MYVPLPRFLLRAPLLPVGTLSRAARALAEHALGADALAVASPTLSAARPGPARRRAVERYARRAAFRATPSGLLAGVCVGTLGPRTDVATGTPVAHLAASWARALALARALLDDPEVRERVSLRATPSLSTAGGEQGAEIRWAGPGDPFGETRTAALDARLGAVLAATGRFAPWPEVRARAAAGDDGADPADVDELLLALVDDGLLQTDLEPPLVGIPAADHLVRRLTAVGCASEAEAIAAACDVLARGDLAGGRAALGALPGEASRDVQAVLVHRPPRTPRLARAAVSRAARLVPLLCRLQQALAPPARELFASRALRDALDAATELHGAGAFELDALAAGDYGLDIDDEEAGEAPEPATPPPALVALLVDACADAARGKRLEAHLDRARLEAALEGVSADAPGTAELFLAPAPQPPGAATPPGTGWLLGLHAPAGASWGRFAHALGAPLREACAELAAVERRARPDELRVDVAFAPNADLADLTAHPPVRARALALSRWTAAADDLTTRDLQLLADPADPAGLALRVAEATDGRTVVPAPLCRVRSSTAPAGAARMLVGWSLQRQHAPWAFAAGGLGGPAFLPRLVLDGFVIAPASWRLPPELARAGARRAALDRWRRACGVPRHVQVGHADELYPVDLQARDAAAELEQHERVFEIWPPLGATVDRDGRRLEAIVAVVDGTPTAPRPDAAPVGRVPPPRRAPPLAGWRTFKLFGAAARQEALLATVVPAVAEGRRGGELDAWFFLRYVDGPGQRHHLRLRVRAPGGDPGPFERRLRAALGPARAAGACTSIEAADYFPERGRFADDELPALHAIFESDSQAAAALLADPELDRIAALPLVCDALARGLGLDLGARHALARERRRAAEIWTGLDAETQRASDADFRRHGRALRAALAETPPDPAAPVARILTDHRTRVAAAAAGLTEAARARHTPTLLHLAAVRLMGPDPHAERLGYTFWERTLEGLRKTR
ncbi:MAG TPA: thiopeptide-type bacteriocin biosynthesis protein [Polyangia bacterium]|nr:thiopeptide-type bacteriocin biosynthesis protein [Polyangia bacterium]